LVGPIGGVLAVPLAAIIQLVFHRWVFAIPSLLEDEPSSDRDDLGVLEYRIRETLHDLYDRMSQPHPPSAAAHEEAIEEEIELVLRSLRGRLQAAKLEREG
jgi:hypothetical protein